MPERRPDAVAVHAGGDRAHDPPVGPDRLLVVEQLRVVQEAELDQPARRGAGLAGAEQRVAAEEVAGLSQATQKARPAASGSSSGPMSWPQWR